MKKLRVAVLMGGRSAEREVSLWTGQQVLAALDPACYDVLCVDTATLGRSRAATADRPAAPPASVPPDAFSASLVPADDVFFGPLRPDVALICLHGRFGEDGTIQGLLELLDIPYTGSGVLASALAMNKDVSKRLFLLEGIPTPESVALTGRAAAELFLRSVREGTAPFSLPIVVKPNEQGSTIGVTIVHCEQELPAALDTALAYGAVVLVERFLTGVEITAPVLGNEAPEVLPLIEIVPSTGFYDFERKYTAGATEEIVPARISPEASARAREIALRAHRALGCRGVSRVDMLLSEGELWVLEVNTIPGMTKTSLLPRSAEAAGIAFPRLLDRLIELALESRAGNPDTTGVACGA